MKGICPVCGKANGCYMVAGKDPSACWCMTTKVPKDLLATIPAEKRGKSCVCKECVTNHNTKEPSPCVLGTDKIEQILLSSNDLRDFFEHYASELIVEPFYEYLIKIIKGKALKLGEVIQRAHLAKTTAYSVLQGERNPSRNLLIQLSFGVEMDLNQTDRMLHLAGKAPLDVRNKRDSIIIFCINRKHKLIDLEHLLDQHGLELVCK